LGQGKEEGERKEGTGEGEGHGKDGRKLGKNGRGEGRWKRRGNLVPRPFLKVGAYGHYSVLLLH